MAVSVAVVPAVEVLFAGWVCPASVALQAHRDRINENARIHERNCFILLAPFGAWFVPFYCSGGEVEKQARCSK